MGKPVSILWLILVTLSFGYGEISNGDGDSTKIPTNMNISGMIMEDVKMMNLKLNSDHNTSETMDFSKMLRLKDMLDVFDIQNIAANWINISNGDLELSENCTQDIENYLKGLTARQMWAIKRNVNNDFSDSLAHYYCQTYVIACDGYDASKINTDLEAFVARDFIFFNVIQGNKQRLGSR